MSRLVISLLGPLQITLGGTPVAMPRGAKTQALLAYLAAEADRPHRREVLAGLLWPDQPEPRSAPAPWRRTRPNRPISGAM